MSKEVQISMTYKVFGADDYEEARHYIGQEGYFTDYPDDIEGALVEGKPTLEEIHIHLIGVSYFDSDGTTWRHFILPVK